MKTRLLFLVPILAITPLDGGTLIFLNSTPVFSEEASPFSGPLMSFSDSDTTETAGALNGTVNWGDGTATPALISGSAGIFTVSGNHTYADEGSYSLNFNIVDVSGGSLSGAFDTGTIADAPLTPGIVPSSVSFTPGVALTNVLLASFTDANSFSSLTDFAATINWGDGTQSVGTISANGGFYDLYGTHTYAASNNFGISATINDVGGSSLSTGTLAVSSAPEPGTIGMVCCGLALAGWLRGRVARL